MKRMTFVAATASPSGGPPRNRYECRRCIIDYTELDHSDEVAPERARKLNRQPIRTLQ